MAFGQTAHEYAKAYIMLLQNGAYM